MSKNYNVTYIPDNIFLEFPLPDLRDLAIAGSALGVLHMSVFKPLKKLVFLDLSTSKIHSIVVDSLPSLNYLLLNNNNIQDDFIETCSNTNESLYPMLRKLNLKNNIIYSVNRRICLPNLEHLELGQNQVYFLKTGSFLSLPKLRVLGLSVMRLRLQFIHPLAFASDSLQFLYMSNSGIDFSNDSISAQMFAGCPKLSLLQLDYNNFSNVNDTKFQELFQGIPMLTTVYLGYLKIKTITSDTFKGLSHVQELILYSNVIEDLPDGVFDELVNLTILRVDDNRLSEIRETTFSVNTRQRIRLLDLSNNPYACTCSLRWFRSWLMDESERFVNFPTGYVCSPFSSSSNKQDGKTAVMADVREVSKSISKPSNFLKRKSQPMLQSFQKVFPQQPLVTTYTETSVSESRGHVLLPPVHSTVYLSDFFLSDQACLLSQSISLLTAVLAAVLVVFMLTFLVLYKYRWHIRLALYEAFRGNPQRRRQQPEREYEYDVFVSYANEDVDWVRQELIPTLEERHGLRLCIHQRDFPVGGNIIDNISTCVHASKRVLFVLSPHFARSRWCQFELVFCQNYVMERDDVLVLTLLAPISGRDMTDAISAMFKTTTYLAWGEEDDARKAFWGRLVLAFHDIVPRQVA